MNFLNKVENLIGGQQIQPGCFLRIIDITHHSKSLSRARLPKSEHRDSRSIKKRVDEWLDILIIHLGLLKVN